jgi:hypothetical protein
MKLLSCLLAWVCVFAANPLCGVWTGQSSGKCELAQSCCVENPPGTCELPLSELNGPGSQEDFQFAVDGGYSILFLLGTGSCASPMTLADGTLSTAILTSGSYVDGGANANLGNGWNKLTYNVELLTVTLTKTNKDLYFTEGVPFGAKRIGPCTNLQNLFNNPGVGCPCNGTWNTGGFSNGVSNATRIINKTSCVHPNGTSTCPENFFFRSSPRYGSYHVNSTGTTRLLQITRPQFNSTLGWNDSVVYASFTANMTCPTTLSPVARSSVKILVPSVVVLLLCIFFVN